MADTPFTDVTTDDPLPADEDAPLPADEDADETAEGAAEEDGPDLIEAWPDDDEEGE